MVRGGFARLCRKSIRLFGDIFEMCVNLGIKADDLTVTR